MSEPLEPRKPKRVAAGPVRPPDPRPPEAGPAAAGPPATRKVLIAGISGGLGKLVLRRLLLEGGGRYRVAGIARTDLEDPLRAEVEFAKLDITQNRAEDIFRRGEIDIVVHLAFDDDPHARAAERYKTNVLGTMRLLDWCAHYGVRKVVIVSTAAVYGALEDNPTLMGEDHPTRGDQTYAEIRDRVEADRYAVAWMWRYPEVETVILRPVHILGAHVENAFRHYVNLRCVPVLLGFDPMMQVVHEEDVARAIHLAVEKDVSGVFNIVGPGAIPLREILRELGAEVVPIPHLGGVRVVHLLSWLGLSRFCAPMADYIKFPLVVSGAKARRELGYEPEVPLRETIRSAKR